MKLKLKKADERYLSIWMFMVWIVIGIALIWEVIIFYSEQADVRYYEADMLGGRVLDCLSLKFTSQTSFDIYSECGLNKDVIENSGSYYLSFSVKEKVSGKETLSFGVGPSSWAVQCEYQKVRKKVEKNFPQCSYRTLEYMGEDGKTYELNLISAVNKA